MKIGTSISLKRFDLESKELENYRCKVIDQNEEYFYIDFPVHEDTKKTTIFSLQERIIVHYAESGFVYEFTSTVVDRVKKNVPALKLKVLDKDKIKRIQRREFVRILTDVDIAVHCPKQSFQPFTSVTQDISGGGASIYRPDISIEKKQKLKLYFVLDSNGYEYIETDAEVVRLHEENNVQALSVKFLFDSESKRQKIIHHCFHIERKNRKLGIM